MLIQTNISHYNKETGHIAYRGYPLLDMISEWSFEQVVYMLLKHKKPDQHELEQFMQMGFLARQKMAEQFRSPSELSAHPIYVCQSILPTLNNFYDDWTLINQVIILMASFFACPILPMENLASQFHLLFSQKPLTQDSLDIFSSLMILYAENISGTSTLVVRACASGGTPLPSALSAAIGGLSGYKHGGAIEAVIPFLKTLRMGELEAGIDYALSCKEKIPGFGHGFFKKGDPRAVISEMSASVAIGSDRDRAIFIKAQQVAELVYQKKGLRPNVDYYSALALHFLGVQEEKFILFFALARLVGWVAHYREQRSQPELYYAQPSEGDESGQ